MTSAPAASLAASAPPTRLHGIWPALLTPLTADGRIDHPRWVAHAHALLAAGCGGLTPFGTTGEGPSFTVEERRDAIDALITGGIPGERLLVSTSCAALPDTLALTRHAVSIGAFGVLMLPPFFLKGVSDAGIVACYRQVIEGTADARLRLMLYHIPQVAGVGLSHAVIAELMRRYPDTIIGIKDSQCERAHSVGLAEAFMPALMVHVGNELDLCELGRRGSTGAVSGLANFIPRLVHRLVSAPDAPGTAADLARVQALLADLGGYALIPALKGVMAARSGDEAWLRVRAPLVSITDEQLERLSAQLAAFHFDPAKD